MKRYITRPKLIAVLIVFLVLSACSKSDDGYSEGNNNNNNNNTSNSVGIGNSSFSPSSITIKAGTTVTWTNNVEALHTVTADDGSFNSGDLTYYKTYSRTFSAAGTFPYHCAHHANMKGTVVVNP
jgi:plastocyanin